MRNWHLCWSWMHKIPIKLRTHIHFLLICWKMLNAVKFLPWDLRMAGTGQRWQKESTVLVFPLHHPSQLPWETEVNLVNLTHMLKIEGAYGVWNNSLFGSIFWKWKEICKLREWVLQLNIKRLLAVVLNVRPAMRHRGGNNEKLVWDHGGVTALSDRGRGSAPAACSGRRARAWKNYSYRDFHTCPKNMQD